MDTNLILIDHDGTLCHTNELAYESIRYTAQKTCQDFQINPQQILLDLDGIIADLTGTTEKKLVQTIIGKVGVSKESVNSFEKLFYINRANWYASMKNNREFIFDTYYPDTEMLMQKAIDKGKYYLMMVTGNPRRVIEERIANHVKKYFCDGNGNIIGSFGDEAADRQELITNAVKQASIFFPGFIPFSNPDGFITNVFYIGDSYNDLLAGLYAKVRTIWIPSRSLQVVKEKNQPGAH